MGMNERWNENFEIQKCEGIIFWCVVILSLLISSPNVLGLSYNFAFADTAEEMSCDAFHFPLEDSRAATNLTTKTCEPKSALSKWLSLPSFLVFPSSNGTFTHITMGFLNYQENWACIFLSVFIRIFLLSLLHWP